MPVTAAVGVTDHIQVIEQRGAIARSTVTGVKTMRTFAKIIAVAAFAAAAIGVSTPSEAGLFSAFQPKPTVVAKISLSQQKLYLNVTDDRGRKSTYVWKVSTGAAGYATPKGLYHPTWLDKNHKSSQYEDAPMPYSVFFVDGIAIHGTTAVSRLGRPASHGCIRLAPDNAATFFQTVEAYGKWNTKIIVTD